MLVAQSSTSTFQQSWAPEQHASLAALRAAETGRPMVHATLTGVSAVYGPSGERVGDRLGTDRSAAAVYDVPLADGHHARTSGSATGRCTRRWLIAAPPLRAPREAARRSVRRAAPSPRR